jgi:hypothetical protein
LPVCSTATWIPRTGDGVAFVDHVPTPHAPSPKTAAAIMSARHFGAPRPHRVAPSLRLTASNVATPPLHFVRLRRNRGAMGSAKKVGAADQVAEGCSGEIRKSGTRRLPCPRTGKACAVRMGRNAEIRPVGGPAGCFVMILVSIVASVLLTVVLNLLLR